jgi:hypothetical protein
VLLRRPKIAFVPAPDFIRRKTMQTTRFPQPGGRPKIAPRFIAGLGERWNGYEQQKKQPGERFHKWNVFQHPPHAAENRPANSLAGPGSLI